MLLRVTFELNLDAFWNKAFAAFLAAAAKDITSGFGGHAGTKSELIFAGALGWLIGAFAHG